MGHKRGHKNLSRLTRSWRPALLHCKAPSYTVAKKYDAVGSPVQGALVILWGHEIRHQCYFRGERKHCARWPGSTTPVLLSCKASQRSIILLVATSSNTCTRYAITFRSGLNTSCLAGVSFTPWCQ